MLFRSHDALETHGFVLMHMENSEVIVACITLASDEVFKRLIGYSWPAIGLIVHYKKVPWMLRG